MIRMFGMMPNNEVEQEKWYTDTLGLTIGVQAGPHGWTILWADGGSTYKDIDTTTEKNFQAALNALKERGFNDLKEKKSEHWLEK